MARFWRTPTRPLTRPGPRPRPTFRPFVERLDERCLPSVVTVTTNADSGPGSLREAIMTADAQTSLTTIDFAIGSGVQTIAVQSPLPEIAAPVVIDGTTQPGFAGTPLIVLDGSAIPTPTGRVAWTEQTLYLFYIGVL